MYLYVLQLFDTGIREDIILAMASSGMKDATVVDGTNLDTDLRNRYPLFSGLRGETEPEQRSILIFGMVEERETMISFLNVLSQAGITGRSGEVFKLMVTQGERLV